MSNVVDALYNLVDSAVKSQIDRMHICSPAVVKSYDSTKNLAVVQLCSARKLSSLNTTELPVIENVPIQFPSTAMSGIVMRLSAGDSVLVHFCDTDISSWVNQGKKEYPVSKRRFNLNDCYATLGASPSKQTPLSEGSDIEIYSGESKISFEGDGSIVINDHLKVTK